MSTIFKILRWPLFVIVANALGVQVAAQPPEIRLYPRQLSGNGEWLYYQEFHNGADSAIVKSMYMPDRLAFQSGLLDRFIGNKHFVSLSDKNIVTLVDLSTKECKKLYSVKKMGACTDNRLAVLQESHDHSLELNLYDTKLKLLKKIPFVSDFTIFEKEGLLFTHGPAGSTIGLYNLKSGKYNVIIAHSHGIIRQPCIAASGRAVAFYSYSENDKSLQAVHYDIPKHRVSYFKPFNSDTFLVASQSAPLKIADDGSRVFLTVRQQAVGYVPATQAEIWNASDKYIHPLKVAVDGWKNVDKVMFWEPITNRVGDISNNSLPFARIISGGNYAILCNPEVYEPQYQYESNCDYYLKDIETGTIRLWIQDGAAGLGQFTESPDKSLLGYFYKGAWYIYDIKVDIPIKLTPSRQSKLTP
ncbi:hypothetical protein AM493_04825 [Flavobacterium akiainvivens]|uniref:Uncharacterized protein n=1 Tax=Flavobacterium akiainvivens TaxID=1202724 RepID=A0A0M8MGR0_9FLAO|nr:hypothetical protein [Flavobacterium akiainvivens]KOS05427.1 hypothetical protein AM493_04825 [Flavobacterium akiainvivens]SFQ78237.1 hypothetical protein SAMN05444144_12914 [Flavobacterium akiainvivens]